MNVSSDDHDVLGESVWFRGIPERETDLDVHLEEDSTGSRESFLKCVGKDALGGDSKLVQAELLDVIVDPSSLVIQNGHYNLASGLNLTLQSLDEVVGSISLNFDTDGFQELDSK